MKKYNISIKQTEPYQPSETGKTAIAIAINDFIDTTPDAAILNALSNRLGNMFSFRMVPTIDTDPFRSWIVHVTSPSTGHELFQLVATTTDGVEVKWNASKQAFI
jgi:hypothetical protein